jgi:hypothetical protein
MSRGKLLALDTPFNIKKRFGVGYNLLLEPKTPELMQEFFSIKSEIDRIILQSDILIGCEESSDSTSKKLTYLVPFD